MIDSIVVNFDVRAGAVDRSTDDRRTMFSADTSGESHGAVDPGIRILNPSHRRKRSESECQGGETRTSNSWAVYWRN